MHQEKILIASCASRATVLITPKKSHREAFWSHLEAPRAIWRQDGGTGGHVAPGRHQQGARAPAKLFLMCPCGHHTQDGHHVVFTCPIHTPQRARLLQLRKEWIDLDSKVYIKEGRDEETFEATEEFFSYLFSYFTSPYGPYFPHTSTDLS